jgi:hypothetical protein
VFKNLSEGVDDGAGGSPGKKFAAPFTNAK